MRTFAAIEVPVGLRLKSALRELRVDLAREKVKWVDFSTLHLTLFFLGETSAKTVGSLSESLARELAGISRFQINLKGLGIFGPRGNPKVVWVGVEPCEPLVALQRIVAGCVVPCGYPPDERGFNPHITVGRVKGVGNPPLLYDAVAASRNILFQQTLADRVILYESTLTPGGAVYSPLVTQRLKP